MNKYIFGALSANNKLLIKEEFNNKNYMFFIRNLETITVIYSPKGLVVSRKKSLILKLQN